MATASARKIAASGRSAPPLGFWSTRPIERGERMNTNDLAGVARALVAPGKGILAADESTGTIEKRFKSINLANTEDNRRAYRELLFTARGAGQYISGVILYDETIRQKAKDGTAFPTVLQKEGT